LKLDSECIIIIKKKLIAIILNMFYVLVQSQLRLNLFVAERQKPSPICSKSTTSFGT